MEKEIVFYQPNDQIKLEVVFEDGTVWLTQAQMVVLFDSSKSNISGHIRNFFKNGEFDRSRTVRKFRTVQQEGDRKIERSIDYFNLEMIIFIGNRVKSSGINQFKIWAEDVIKARTSSLMIPDNSIRNLIKTIRNQQVMLDSDLAVLYGVDTKVLNQAVNRNIERFPEDFMFQLTWEECENLRSQIVTSSLRSQFVTLNSKQGQHIKYLPYVFTEQGVAMLSGVLHSPTAIEANIRIMRVFVGMRHFINENENVFKRIETLEYHQLEMEHHQNESDKKMNEIFDRLDKKEDYPSEGIFYDGQIFDAYIFISNLIRKAKNEIVLIDNYVDESVLNILSKRNANVNAIIYTSRISHQFQLDLERYNSEYQPITVNVFNKCHDRFLIIDDEVYHIGASLKDLGRKWFAFSILNFPKEEIIGKLK